MDTKEKLRKLWNEGITKDAWGYEILEADLDGILKLTAEWIDKNFSPVEPEVSGDFGEPEIKKADFDKWLADQKFYSESEGTPIDKYILENYFDSIEQFIKSPMSKAAKGVFEVATQVIKKYLSQNSR